MSEGGPLINVNLGDLSKTATVLIEKISDAVGAAFLPSQIKRIAKAEAEAAEIRALADIKVTKVQHRALARMIQEEGKKQENIEKITALAISDLRADAKPENIENDWLAHFFEKCRIVSDTEMQSLWARLLAGEANRPGTFSRRTLAFIPTLDKQDADLFTRLCQFCWDINGDAMPLVYDIGADIYNQKGINFDALKHLDDIGLVTYNVPTQFYANKLPKQTDLLYFGTPVPIQFPYASGNKLPVGHVLLTKIGSELFAICGATRLNEVPAYVISKLKDQDLEISFSSTISPASEPTERAKNS